MTFVAEYQWIWFLIVTFGANVGGTPIKDNGMASLKTIILPKSIRGIDNNAFIRCYKLERIVFPEGMVCIGSYAFRHCNSLKVVYLPSTLTKVGLYAFCNTALKEVRCKATTVPILIEGFGYVPEGEEEGTLGDGYYPKTTATLYIPKGSTESYKAKRTDGLDHRPWSECFSKIVEE